MTDIAFDGRLFFLSCDPLQIEAQLRGEDLAPADIAALRDDVSTDEITPIPVLSIYDDRLGSFPYVGVSAGQRLPVAKDSVKNGGFAVTVAGKRYGKGSSREHSPVAEMAAGIRLVIATSFERIYRQNADNLGLFTSTDFGLVERIRQGQAIELEDLLASRDELAKSILVSGGLLRYGQQSMQEVTHGRQDTSVQHAVGPQTYFEKILARHIVTTAHTSDSCTAGVGCFVVADWRFIHEYYTGMCMHMLNRAFGADVTLYDSTSVIAFEDHLSYLHRSEIHLKSGVVPNLRQLSAAHRAFVVAYKVRAHGMLPSGEGSEGISHAVLTEKYALPGQVVVGTDSHTPHSGSVGCLAFGVGTTDMANALVTGAVRLTVPESIRVELGGRWPRGVSAKDLVLHLLADPAIKDGAGVGKVFEFTGSALAYLSTDERATLTNMTAELGGFTGLIAPDAETVRFLRERRSIDFELEPWMCSDAGAHYSTVIRIDCSAISPMVALPGDPGNGIPLAALAERVRLDIAYGGSCTAGKRDDFDSYFEVLSWAHEKGLKVAHGVQLFLQFGTVDVRDYCIARGYVAVFEAVGAELLQPSCGACANCGPGSSTLASQVTVSAVNRNFPGRSGPGQVWLASPATVAASAIAGNLLSFEELRCRVGIPAEEGLKMAG